ncbi:Uncharacterised protein [Chlamydia abortus]|nr:Uncharacterised protein [Chlamydia abortus]
MKRFVEARVLAGLVTACLFAGIPTKVSFPLNATIDGVVRVPSEETMTFACPPSITDTQEFVVPKSIPIILLDFFCSLIILT